MLVQAADVVQQCLLDTASARDTLLLAILLVV